MSITPTWAEARKSLQARLLLLCLDAKCVAAVHHRDQLVPATTMELSSGDRLLAPPLSHSRAC